MNLNISFKNMDSSPALKDFITDKSEQLVKYFDGNINLNWFITIEGMFKTAHCHVLGRNIDFFGEGVSQDFKACVDIALSKVEKQIRRRKEIARDHLHRHGHRMAS